MILSFCLFASADRLCQWKSLGMQVGYFYLPRGLPSRALVAVVAGTRGASTLGVKPSRQGAMRDTLGPVGDYVARHSRILSIPAAVGELPHDLRVVASETS